MLKKKQEYIGPVDQYGRPIDTSNIPDHAEDDRKLGIIFFTILGITTIIVLVFIFIFNYFRHNRLEIPRATLSTTEWTNESVTVTVDRSRGNVSEFSFDGGKTWQESNQFEVYENQELVIQVRNKKGKMSKKATVVVSNIDRDLPELYFIDPFYIETNDEFDPKVNVSVLDSGSGIEDYNVNLSGFDIQTPGEYQITYYVSDLVGNQITKTRKIIVEEGPHSYQYRSRTFKLMDSTCDSPCECKPLVGDNCSEEEILQDSKSCCRICTEPCKEFQYGPWSNWDTEKIIPTSDLDVEMKSELLAVIQE